MKITYGKPRQCGGERLMLHMQQKQAWEAMYPNTPYPFEYGGVMTQDGLVTFGVYEKERHLPVPIKHYQL
jgi:hypothetical protein